ncbi:hypothetical protein AB0H73_15145 [Streptomyces olivoreticuli]
MLDGFRAEVLSRAADSINALGSDDELGPGWGDASDRLRRMAGEAGKDTRKGESTRTASPWRLAADGLNALVNAGVPFQVEPDGHISNPCGDEHIAWDRRAGRWIVTSGDALPATVEFSVDGSVILTDWDLVELVHDYFGTSHMQIGGWLPEDYEPGSVSLGTNCMVRADLPGRAVAAHDVNVTVDVKGYGGSRRFMKIQWPHTYDPNRDARLSCASENGGVR